MWKRRLTAPVTNIGHRRRFWRRVMPCRACIYRLKHELRPPLNNTRKPFVRALAIGLKDREQQGKPLPELVLETGRAVVDEAEWLISSVVAK